MNFEEINPQMEEVECKTKKPRKRGVKERVTNLIARAGSDSIQFLYEDILEENEKLKSDVDKLRGMLSSIQREYDELRQGMLIDRMNKLI